MADDNSAAAPAAQPFSPVDDCHSCCDCTRRRRRRKAVRIWLLLLIREELTTAVIFRLEIFVLSMMMYAVPTAPILVLTKQNQTFVGDKEGDVAVSCK
jgi:hypothetical protein